MVPLILTTFLKTCMKLLRDNKAVKGLQELITRCARLGEPCMVQNLESMLCIPNGKCD